MKNQCSCISKCLKREQKREREEIKSIHLRKNVRSRRESYLPLPVVSPLKPETCNYLLTWTNKHLGVKTSRSAAEPSQSWLSFSLNASLGNKWCLITHHWMAEVEKGLSSVRGP